MAASAERRLTARNEQLFDAVAIRVDGPRAATESVVIDCHFTDTGTTVPSPAFPIVTP